MKITVSEEPGLSDVEITIRCPGTNAEILKIIAALRLFEQKIVGVRDGQNYFLPAESILYIESVDKKTFLYCINDVYEAALRLYEFEERLSGSGFLRASKSMIVNLSQIHSLRPDFGGRLIATMNNDEKIYVSRQYAGAVKDKLGL